MKLLKKILCCVLVISTIAVINPVESSAATKSTKYSWKKGCNKSSWPYKTGTLAKYNPCKVYTETTYFSKKELGKMASDLGYGSGIGGLGVGGWKAITKQMLKRTSYGLAASGTIALAAETMYRGTSKNIKGWKIVYKYNYERNWAHHDTIPTRKNISIKWVPVKK